MTHISLPLTNDVVLLKRLAQRLGFSTKDIHKEVRCLSEAEELKLLKHIAGSWKGEETGDELYRYFRL